MAVDVLGPGQLAGEHHGQADLVVVDVRIGRNDGSARVIHALAHHVLPEQTCDIKLSDYSYCGEYMLYKN